MKKSNFLIRLHGEKKLKLVEPSNEVKDAYLKKSESHLESTKLLQEHEKLEEAISTAYYSMYHMTLALFFKIGIKCENHSAAIILLDTLFGIDNRPISEAKKERIDKQYYVDFSIAREDVDELIAKAENFNAEVLDFIERLNSEIIEKYRKTLKIMLDG